MIVVHVEFPKRPLSLSLSPRIHQQPPPPPANNAIAGGSSSLPPRAPIWSMITDDKQFHTVPRLHTWQINWYTTECVAAYLRRRNAAFHTLRSLLLAVGGGGVVIGIGSPGWLPPFTHTRKIREPAVRNGQTTVTQYYSLLASCSSTRGTSRCSGGEIDGSTLRIYRSRGRVTRV